MTDRHLPASHAAILALPPHALTASSLSARVVLRGALLLAMAATQSACGGPDFAIGAPSSMDAGPDGESPDVDNGPIIICNPCSPDPTGDSAGDALPEVVASDATADHRIDAAGAEAGVADATVDVASGDASLDVAADRSPVEGGDVGPSSPLDGASEASVSFCGAAAEGSPCGANKVCHDTLCVDCNVTSCQAGCCSTHGCVIAGQSTSECGVGVGGAACTACPPPSGGTGGATCSGNACGISCTAPTPDLCGATCVSLQGDTNSCGACGHSCLGGACVSGQCQPLTVADNLAGYVFGLGIDSTSIYFTTGSGGQVAVCPLAACGAGPTYIKTGIGFAGYLTYPAGTSTLLVSDINNGIIYSMTTGGVTNYTITGLSFPGLTATDGSFMWWGEQGRVGSADFASGADVHALVTTPDEQSYGVWYDNATRNVFAAVGGAPGEALECTIQGACTHVASASYFYPTSILVQGGTMYFGTQGSLAQNYADGGLFSAPVNNPTNVTALAVGPNYARPLSMTADSSYVYFFSFQSTNIYKCALTGCGGAPTEIAASQVEVPAMVNDAQYVYWGGNSHVLKVAK